MTGGQISAWEKADETSVAEEDQAEDRMLQEVQVVQV
jgi:hypothetical protein